MRYAEILAADSLCEVTKATVFCGAHNYLRVGKSDDVNEVFSQMNLAVDEIIPFDRTCENCYIQSCVSPCDQYEHQPFAQSGEVFLKNYNGFMLDSMKQAGSIKSETSKPVYFGVCIAASTRPWPADGRGVSDGEDHDKMPRSDCRDRGGEGIDPETGIIKGKILVRPGSKGSNGWSCYFGAARVAGAAPLGWIFTRIDSSAGVATAVMQIPTVVDFEEDQDPCRLIENGDRVRMNGQTGEIKIFKSGSV